MAFNKNKNKQYDEGKDLTTSKIAIIAEWIWRVFVLNVLTFTTCLGIITIVPAFTACFRTIKACFEEDETHYIRSYYKNFVYCFKDTVLLSLFTFFIIGLLAYAYYYYSVIIDTLVEDENFKGWLNLYSILLGLDVVFFIVLLFIVVQFPMVATYFHFRFLDKIRFSFYMAYRHGAMTILIFLIFLANTALLIWMPLYALVGYFSIQILSTFLISRKAYWNTARKMDLNTNLADEYDRKGTSVNRETYEDKNEETIDNEKIENLRKINEDIVKGEDDGKTRNR